jgi:hypothetical protein
VTRITEHEGLHPIMFYRPSSPGGSRFLQLHVAPGAPLKRTATLVHGLCKDGSLQRCGFHFADRREYEAEVWLLCCCCVALPCSPPNGSSRDYINALIGRKG